MKHVNLRHFAGLLAAALILGLNGATAAHASIVNFNNYVHIGTGMALDGSLTAVVQDIAPNQVEITMNSMQPNSGFVTKWGFNLDPSFTDYAGLSHDAGTVTGGATLADTIDLGPANSYSITGAAIDGFDIGFSWTGSNHGFDLNSSVTYVLTYSGSQTFNALSFYALNDSGKWFTAAKVQGIDPGNKSGEVGVLVPEPASIALFGLGGFGAAAGSCLRRRRDKSST